MQTAVLASKIRTAAVAVAVVFGVAGPIAALPAAAQNVNPFVDGKIPHYTSPKTNTPNISAPAPKNPNSTEGHEVEDVDAKLTRYLVGVWQGSLTNGQTVKIAFLKDGRFALANVGSDTALVGRFSVAGGQIQFRITSRCSISTRQCESLSQSKTTTVGFRPMDSRTFAVSDGTLRRVS